MPRDGSAKTFTLSSTTLSPDLVAHSAPALDETAYLDLSFVQNEEAPLLPGEVAIQRDGVFIGKGRFPLVAPGDKATLGVGADDRIKIIRVPLRQKEHEPGWIGSNSLAGHGIRDEREEPPRHADPCGADGSDSGLPR